MLELNVSQLQAFIRCPRFWFNRYVVKRSGEAPEGSAALRIGTAWHTLMEHALEEPNAGQLLEVCSLTGDEWERTLFIEGLTQFHQWVDENPEYELLEAEKEGSFVLDGRFKIFGRLDRLVKFNGQYWHMQHKTMSANKSVGHYTTAIRRSFHEYAYRRMCEAEGLTPYGGSILMMLRKVKDPLSTPPLILPPAHLATKDTDDGWREKSLIYWCEQIERVMADVENGVPQNPESCYTWGLCEYVPMCDSLQDVADLPLRDPFSHYDTSH